MDLKVIEQFVALKNKIDSQISNGASDELLENIHALGELTKTIELRFSGDGDDADLQLRHVAEEGEVGGDAVVAEVHVFGLGAVFEHVAGVVADLDGADALGVGEEAEPQRDDA